jgi:hypothetical protein
MTTETKAHAYPALGLRKDVVLLDAIERDSVAIARLLETCGSSQNFGPAEQYQFGRLLRHRRELLARLEGLRYRGGPQRRVSGK